MIRFVIIVEVVIIIVSLAIHYHFAAPSPNLWWRSDGGVRPSRVESMDPPLFHAHVVGSIFMAGVCDVTPNEK